ncbi:MAG: hypothetical protein NUV78_00530 [Candidatus Zambryskibacteria bacterium]|nr:hypothetical protein [Candidatus Zambryskibacteria bacterium]
MEEEKKDEKVDKKEKGLKSTTVVLMITVALFFDALQVLLTFIFMGWLAGFFAGLTFYVWFRMHGISFMKPKRLAAFGGTALIELIPFLSVIPAWTFAVAYLAISSRLPGIAPGSEVIKLDIMKR